MSARVSAARRQFLRQAAASGLLFTTPGLFAEMLALTPRQTEGPFYPDKLPLDTDNDLLIINDGINPGVGQITHLTGRVLSASGEPVRNAVVEIWQADGHGAYLHSGTSNADQRDGNFQGFGRFLTDVKGQYYFRTIKPVPYPGRTPHIHFAVEKDNARLLTTQMYIQDDPLNAQDGIYGSLGDQAALLAVEFAPLEGSELNELTANFDIVIGSTPEDREQPRSRPGRRSR